MGKTENENKVSFINILCCKWILINLSFHFHIHIFHSTKSHPIEKYCYVFIKKSNNNNKKKRKFSKKRTNVINGPAFPST